jgi:hypothetical protein
MICSIKSLSGKRLAVGWSALTEVFTLIGAVRISRPVAFLCALRSQRGASWHNRRQLATTRKTNIKKEMQGKCLSGLDLDFGSEMSC